MSEENLPQKPVADPVRMQPAREEEELSADELELDEPIPEEEERTIRRHFAPKTPPKVPVEISDADATWKWTRARADEQGVFTGVALPLLDGDAALKFDPTEVEVTQQTFALKATSAPIPLARRRAQPKRRPVFVAELTQEVVPFKTPRFNPRVLGVAVLMVLVAVGSALAVQSRVTRIAAIGVAMRTPEDSAPAVLEPTPVAESKTTGTITATVKGVKVFVDGKPAGDSSQSLTAACGSHVVQVGVSGVARMVAVPCGGDVSVAP